MRFLFYLIQHAKLEQWPPAPLPARRLTRRRVKAYATEGIMEYWNNGKKYVTELDKTVTDGILFS